MEDDAPLRRFVTRTHSFDQVDFDALIQNPDLYTVHNAAEAGLSPRHYASATPPTGVKQPVVLNRPRRSSGERPRSKSVLGMPTFRPDSTFYKYWSSLILALDLTYSAFVVPISIGMLTSFLVLNWTSALDYTVGAFFLADLIVSFHVGFIATYNLRKVLVLNGKLIAKFYMQHDTFIFDILSVTAWLVQLLMLLLSHVVDEFNPTVALFIMEALRLVRFLRVVKLIRKLLVNAVYAPLNQSSWMKWASSATFHYLFYIVYVIAVLVNFLGCMWNFTAGAQGFDNTWANYYPPFVRSYSEDGMTALTADEVQNDVDQVWRYFVGTYWALTTIATVGFGDVTPATLVETIVVIIVEVIGIMFFGILLELLSNSNKDARRAYVFRKKLTTVDRWMKGTRLPSHLQRRIKSFYAEVWLHHVESSEDTHLFRELPHILRNEVAWNALQAAMARIPFFEDMSTNMKWTLCSKFEPVRFGPGEDILSEGDKAEKCWVMLEGEVVSLHHYVEAGSMQGPALLGSTVVLQDLVRWKDLRLLLDYHPNVRRALESRIMAQVCCHITLYPSAWMDSQLLHPELQDAKARAEEMAKDLWEGPSQSQVAEGFVIKTSDESGNKVFLNVCADAAVPLPDGWSPGEPLPPAVKRYLEAGPEGSAPSSGDALMSLLAFPMWLSDLRRDSDHTGADCGVLDCVLHTDILRHAAEVRPLKLYAIQLVLSEVAHKRALRLNPQYKLPRMRYKGQGPIPHAVPAAEALTRLPQEQPVLMPGQGAERPGLVREVLAGRDKGLALRTMPAPRPAARERSEACEESADPSTTLQAKLRYHGCPVEAVSVEVALTPALVATARRAVHAVHVTVTGQRVSIALPACPALEVGLPFFVRPEQGTARVTAQGLHVTLPYRPLEEVHPRTA